MHIAVAAEQRGWRTLLGDLDEHSRSSAEWAQVRENTEAPVVIDASGTDIPTLKQQVADNGFDLLILDCPPYVNEIVASATEAADYTLIPCQPRFNDMRTLSRVIDSVHEPYTVVLNACTPGLNSRESSKTNEARSSLVAAGIDVCPVSIVRREALTDALNSGAAVLEFEPDGKAAKEMNELFQWVEEKFNGQA